MKSTELNKKLSVVLSEEISKDTKSLTNVKFVAGSKYAGSPAIYIGPIGDNQAHVKIANGTLLVVNMSDLESI